MNDLNDPIHFHYCDDLNIQSKIEVDSHDTYLSTKANENSHWNSIVISPEIASVMISALTSYMEKNKLR